MTNRIWSNAIYGIMAVLYVAYCAVFNTQFMLGGTARQPLSFADIVDGKAAGKFEAAYRKAALYREWAIGVFGSYRYLVFNEGRSGVLVGNDGWLFTDEEFRSAPDAGEKLQRTVDFISEIRNRLAVEGTRLTVALVPAKAEIYAEELGRFTLPAEPANRYDRARALLALRNVEVPDLRSVLLEQKEHDRLFLKTDTHWTPAGAIAVAGALATSGHRITGANPPAFALHETARFDVDGDLARFLGGAIKSGENIQLYEASSVQEIDSTADLFGQSGASVVLVGTSYSANEKWGFEAALKSSLGEDVVNVAEQGEGPFKPMASYVDSGAFRQAPPELVIWEIPVRYMLSYTPGESSDGTESKPAVSASR